MRGLCIGTGDWRGIAMRAANQMEAMTGITCGVVDRADNNLVHSSWHKLNLLRDYPDEQLLIFDADLWCAMPWDPCAYADTGLAMVVEPAHHALQVEAALYHVPAGRYFNAGLIIADGRAQEVFAATKRLHPRYGSWLEQTGLSHNIAAMKYPVHVMPQACNHLVKPALSMEEIHAVAAINKHFAGPKTLARLSDIFDSLEAVP